MPFAEELTGKNIELGKLMTVCKYRQGEAGCKYIVFFKESDDYFCVKNIPNLRSKIEGVEMDAKGDNCPGL